MVNKNFCISQAPVGQRSAQSPQCKHTSSSLTMTREDFSVSETYKSWSSCEVGARNRCRKSGSSPLLVMVRQSIGQISIQASHSIHVSCVKTVWISQFKQRCASLKAVAASKPSSTSTRILANAFSALAHGTLKRWSSETSLW